ncbi:EAL domain-containing protein [Priestia megaterium]|uniref:EAL domain-containing protein n=1 Tax=Priestia megaterium TaxID=1404 RepID=UPI0021BE2840|nr:EAL domain-containing protein [Priestia megaterium]MCT9856991.1 EAL domain-containing protein [Priestia megaterium]MDF1961869.1 EAL domain-containing protein [Priestia megaterium]
MNHFTENLEGVLELTVFNPKNFGKRNQNVYLNGNKYIKIKDQPIWYGTYTYRNTECDKKSIRKALKTGKSQSYTAEINHKKVLKTLVPIKEKNSPAYVIGVVYDYGLIEKELQQELIKHLLLSLPYPIVLVNEIKHFLSLHSFDPTWFEMEITESTLLTNAEETINALHLLKKYGISISIDDFGTGYSSLSYLKKLPIDCLKIDRSFIQYIQEDYSNSEIARAIISLSQSLKLQVIAEGVEEEYQKAFLMENGCDHMQGYLFSKPLAAKDFEAAFLNS